jgi:hypothetical protein
MTMTIDEVVAMFVSEAEDDIIGLWEVIKVAGEDTDEGKGENLRKTSIEIVRRMLARGFWAGDMIKGGSAVDPWPDQQPEAVIARIEAEWSALGRVPNIGDIVYFERDDAN